MYAKLAGMTGTAKTEEQEFIKIYGLPVLQVPTNKPILRKDLPDVVFKTKAGKYRAVVKEVQRRPGSQCLLVQRRSNSPKNSHIF